MVIFVLLLLGLILGSFTNAMVWRLHAQAELAEHGHKKGQPTKTELSMLKGRSMCSNCHHELAPKDLIPLFSWLWLRGRCRYCRKSIQDSPLIEVILPLVFVVSYLLWPLPLDGVGLYRFIFWLGFLVAFMALAAYDLRWFILPDRLTLPLIGVAAVMTGLQAIVYGNSWHLLLNSVAAIAVTSGFFYLLYVVSKGNWIGGGDVKLGVILGIWAGNVINGMLVLFIASVLGTLVAIPQLVSGKANRASKLPFGPYLLLATIIVVLFGAALVNYYERSLGLR